MIKFAALNIIYNGTKGTHAERKPLVVSSRRSYCIHNSCSFSCLSLEDFLVQLLRMCSATSWCWVVTKCPSLCSTSLMSLYIGILLPPALFFKRRCHPSASLFVLTNFLKLHQLMTSHVADWNQVVSI